MRRVGFWILALGLAGCSPAPQPESNAPTPPPTPAPTSPPAPSAKTSAKAELDDKQLTQFFTKLGAKIGHGGLPPEAITSTVASIKAIKPGAPQTGTLHMDHQGGHENVTMTAEPAGKGKYRLTFTSTNPTLLASIEEMLSTTK
jgi:hypothetical protein